MSESPPATASFLARTAASAKTAILQCAHYHSSKLPQGGELVKLSAVRKFAMSLPDVTDEPHHDYGSFG